MRESLPPAPPQPCGQLPPVFVCGVRGPGWGWAPRGARPLPSPAAARAALSAPGMTVGVGRARILPGEQQPENTAAVAPSQSRSHRQGSKGTETPWHGFPGPLGAQEPDPTGEWRADREAGRLEVQGVCRAPARRPNWSHERNGCSGSGATVTATCPPLGAKPSTARCSPPPGAAPRPPPPPFRPLQLIVDSGDTQTYAFTQPFWRDRHPHACTYTHPQMPLCIQYHTRSLALSLFLRFSRVEPPNTQTNGWIVRGSGRSAPCRKPPSRAAGPAQAYWLRTAVRPGDFLKVTSAS